MFIVVGFFLINILYYIVLYCIVLYCSVSYCIVTCLSDTGNEIDLKHCCHRKNVLNKVDKWQEYPKRL